VPKISHLLLANKVGCVSGSETENLGCLMTFLTLGGFNFD